MTSAKKVVAVTSFVATIAGDEHFVHQGDTLPAGHPAVKAHPELFAAPEPTRERVGSVR